MPARVKIGRYIGRSLMIMSGTLVVGFAVLVLTRMAMHSPRAEAASVIYYPNFCLGGWKYPQHASGPSAVTPAKTDPSQYTVNNSAYLESSVASQIFCGYFSVRDAKNPPTKAVISFNWNFGFPDDSSTTTPVAPDEESYTSPEGYVTIPAADIIVPADSVDTSHDPVRQDGGGTSPDTSSQQGGSSSSDTDQGSMGGAAGVNSGTQEDSSTTEITPAAGDQSSGDQGAATDQSTSGAGSAEADTEQGSTSDTTSSDSTQDSSDAGSSASTESAAPESSSSSSGDTGSTSSSESSTSGESSAPQSSSGSDAPQSYRSDGGLSSFIAHLIATQVNAAEIDVSGTPSFKDFLEVSYSLDGIRWTAIGRVNKDNWKGYKVEIPVTSWDEVKRLQIMLSVLPTIDQKPDIYLDSMSMRAEYNQTLAELAAQGLAAVTNAVDALIGDGNGPIDAYEILAEVKKPPQTIEIKKRVLSFELEGMAKPLAVEGVDEAPAELVGRSASGESVRAKIEVKNDTVVASGSCSKKYFVLLSYKNETDYIKKISSSLINQAHECVDGSFSYDLASLPADTTRDGEQYLLIAEQDETGPWTPISQLYPLRIQASTTIETVEQDQ